MSIDADLTRAGYRRDPATLVWSAGANADFAYNDGDEIERRLARIVESAADTSVASPELAAAISDWPSLYHLSRRRSNLLRPFASEMPGPVLEIGAGMGVLTRYLGEAGKEVLALEGSPRRARIAARRCAGLPGVHVVADPFQSFAGRVSTRFGSVLLIGVLEYARVHFATGDETDAVDALLLRARQMLAENGILHLAIENQLGLKYLAGYPEDHLGERMVGIEDRYGDDSIVTFGRAELRARLDGAGLPAQDWWFPLPDYKLPTTVISERSVGTELDAGSLAAATVLFDAQRPADTTFSLQQAWRAVARNDLLPELANSFLVRASPQALPVSDDLAWHFGPDRAPRFAKSVRFRAGEGGSIEIERRPLDERFGTPGERDPVAITVADEPFVQGENWRDRLALNVSRPGWGLDGLVIWAGTWWRALLEAAHVAPGSPAGTEIAGDLLDAIPHNLLVAGGAGRFIDLEWTSKERLDLGRMAVRGLADSLLSIERFASPGEPVDLRVSAIVSAVSAGLGLPLTAKQIEGYFADEARFQAAAGGSSATFDPDHAMAREITVHPGLDRMFAATRQTAEGSADHSADGSADDSDALRRTVSWRITAPLRAVRRATRRRPR